MPKKPEYPEHWKEEDEEVVFEPVPLRPEMVADEDYPTPEELYQEEIVEADLANSCKTPDDYLNEKKDELISLEEEYADLEAERQKKKQIKETKRKIRRLKYEPVYEAGETLREGIGKAAAKISALKGTPEQRAARKAGLKKTIQRVARGSKGMMDKLGGLTGDQDRDRDQIFDVGGGLLLTEKPTKKKKTLKEKMYSENIFGIGATAGGLDLGHGKPMGLLGTGDKPRILEGEKAGTGMLTSNILGIGKGTGKMDFGSNLMTGDVMGAITGRSTRVKKRKGSKKGSKKKKKPTLRLI